MITHHACQSIPGELGHVAVLLLIINTDTGTIRGASITQANPTLAMRNVAYAELARASGTSWADAARQLHEFIDMPHNEWIKRLLTRR